jgi:outer membrane immunogenic protein
MKLAHKFLAGAALAVLSAAAAPAADLLINTPADPIYSSPLFNFEGLYVGATAGGALTGGTLYGTLGVVVGANFAVTDGIIAGVEFQGDTYWNGGFTAYDALALGRVGGFVSDNAMLYGDLGVGIVDGSTVYAFGGGVELGMTDQISVRGDLQGLGAFGGAPSAAKATVGLVWHID